ncbi:hypothetical protein FRB96_006537 [Tulasnella sp. 330]|nr:hypothetical protein FRB96_006537 [Tulasnella sp. 330]
MELVPPISKALNIPEVLDNILLQAKPSAQAAAAQTCQYWSDHSLCWLWRDMTSFYPLLELLSDLEYGGDEWEFVSEPSEFNWERFSRYADYVHSIIYDQTDVFRGHSGRPSDQLANAFLDRPTSNISVLPHLTRIHWTVIGRKALMQLPMFLVPTVTILRIECWAQLEKACIKVLKVLAYSKILLTELFIAMMTHTQAFVSELPGVLANQRRLIRVGLPYYTASRQVVAALATLPSLEVYVSWSFIEYQTPQEIGMEFDWEQGVFTTLKTFALLTSMGDMIKVMSRPHQPRLDSLKLISRDFLKHAHLHSLCSSLSNLQPNLTTLFLALYSEPVNADPSLAIPFNLVRPLLLCATLRDLYIHSHQAMEYNDEDIASMAIAWPGLEALMLCANPAHDVGSAIGQPLRSVRSFTQRFCALRDLGLYLNTLDTNVIPGVPMGPPQTRLSVLNFGTSPIPTDSTDSLNPSKATYVASLLERHAEIKSERSVSHTRFLETDASAESEYSRRKKFWSSFVTEIHNILSGTTHLIQETTTTLP